MQNFEGTTKSIIVFLKKAYSRVNYHNRWINLKVPGKKRTNFPNFSVDNKSGESWGKLVLKNC